MWRGFLTLILIYFSKTIKTQLQYSVLFFFDTLTDEKVKNVITEMIHYAEEPLKVNLSEYLSEKLNQNYTYLANLFSEVQGTTIEQFMILHKVERIKELIIYDELNITEIAWKMNYRNDFYRYQNDPF